MFGIRKRSRTDGSSALDDAPTTTAVERRNLAGRMGRWSAAHWKTATFGWIAFVVVAFGLGGDGRHEDHRPERVRSGRVRPDGQDPRGRLQAARRRERPDPEPHRFARPIPPSGRPSRTSSRASRQLRVVQNVRSPLEPGNVGPDRGEQSCGARRVRDPRRRRTRPPTRSARSLDRGRRGAAGPPAVLHRRVRRRQCWSARCDRLRRGPREGGAALAADHADHPRGRVRGARRGGHSAAPRPDRGVRDVRAGRHRQPGVAPSR